MQICKNDLLLYESRTLTATHILTHAHTHSVIHQLIHSLTHSLSLFTDLFTDTNICNLELDTLLLLPVSPYQPFPLPFHFPFITSIHPLSVCLLYLSSPSPYLPIQSRSLFPSLLYRRADLLSPKAPPLARPPRSHSLARS